MSLNAPTPESMDFELIQPDPGLISPDVALDAALAPVEEIETIDAPVPFGRTWRFDFQDGQFVRDGGAPQVVYDLDTLIVWVEKTLRTAQLAHPIYGDDYGVPEPFELIGQAPDEHELSAHEEAITSALLFHDRIMAVEDFEFSQDPFEETLQVSFTVQVDVAEGEEPVPVQFTSLLMGQAS